MHQASNPVAIAGGRMMVGFERDQDVGVLRPDAVGLIKGQHEGERRQADIVADAVEFAGRNHSFDAALDAVDETLGLLDARAGGRAQMHLHHAGIDTLGKKSSPTTGTRNSDDPIRIATQVRPNARRAMNAPSRSR